MNQYKVTFTTQRGYIVAVIYNKSESEKDAIESAKFYVAGRYTKARAERMAERMATDEMNDSI
jgi:hypothetical protein